jgi:hypothetical protein
MPGFFHRLTDNDVTAVTHRCKQQEQSTRQTVQQGAKPDMIVFAAMINSSCKPA